MYDIIVIVGDYCRIGKVGSECLRPQTTHPQPPLHIVFQPLDDFCNFTLQTLECDKIDNKIPR